MYNTEAYLRECLDSVVNQTLKDIEIICVNDGSTDKSGDILNEYAQKDKRIIVIHQKNMGSALARQSAMDIARGEYIKYVDSDDYIDLRTLEICYNEAKKDDVDILVHGAYAFNQDKQWVCTQFSYQLITEQLFTIPVGAGWAYMHRTDFIKENEISYRGVANMGEDQCFNMQCLPLAKKIKLIPDLLYYYRRHPASLCSTMHGVKHAKDHVNNIRVVYKHWKEKGYFSQNYASTAFLSWVMKLHYWPNNKQICKMFYDTLNKLDPNLLTDKKIISQLTKAEQDKLKRILVSATPKPTLGKNVKDAQKQTRRLSRFTLRHA